MTHHTLSLPIGEKEARALKVGDTVTLERTLFGIRDATLIHMFDRDRRSGPGMEPRPLRCRY